MGSDENNKMKIPLIGLLAVKNLLITKKDLQKGLSQCAGSPDLDLALKNYFLSKELISSKNMERLLRAAKALDMRQKEFKFGAIAIRKGFINQSVLKLALEEQDSDIKNKRKIRLVGDLLVDAGLLSEKQRDYILKLQKRVRQEVKKTIRETGQGAEAASQETSASPSPQSDDAGAGRKEGQMLLEPEIIAGGIKLEISTDFMAAFLSKTDYFDKNITLSEIKDALFEKGILQGLSEDRMIEGFINSSGFKTKSFRVAKGISPIQGKNAKVEFFFNTDYLTAGGLTKDGSIDFKNRGEIPHVEEGTVLAEKIPMVESRRGHNIYGDEIDTIPGTDIVLKIGKGAKLSEDGFKVLAAVKGTPKYALSGHIFVHQEYVTGGDVDYETGHISYDGNVVIKGRIKSGFKVKGNDIQAVELDGGVVDASGDVRILGGINEGKIYSRGNVYAKFIHKSDVICMGNVVIEKEIVDSDIECSGCCVVSSGKVISSRVTAKMGVRAKNIGTEMASQSLIKVGHDVFTEKELQKNKDQLDALKKQIDHHLKKKEKLKQDNLALQQQITELAHVQDRSQLEEKEMNSKISSLETEAGNTEAVAELKKKIEQLQLHAQQAEQGLDASFDKSEKIEEIMGKEDQEINTLEKRRQDLLTEKENLIAWAKANPGKPVVIVEGTIMPETHIKGRHSEMRVGALTRHAKIMEVLCTSDDGQSLNVYEMRVGSI